MSNAFSSFTSEACPFVQSGLVFEQFCPDARGRMGCQLPCLVKKLCFFSSVKLLRSLNFTKKKRKDPLVLLFP